MLQSTLYLSPNKFSSIKQIDTVSPGKAMISQVQEKLSELAIKENQGLRKETYEQRLQLLDEKYKKAYNQDLNNLNLLQLQLNQIEESLTNDKIIRESVQAKFTQSEIPAIESHFSKELQKDKKQRREFELKFYKLIDDQSYRVRLELTKQAKRREEDVAQQQVDIENRILNLNEGVEIEKREREQACQTLIRRFGDSVLSVQETLTKEKQQRQQSQNQMIAMMQEMNNLLTLQLAEEQNQLIETEKTMLRLLGETVTRVQNTLKPN